jgi:4-amino-4-deoxy-L-arabinose transferase-like glycosyltransferase
MLLRDPTRTLSWGPTLFRVLLAGHGLALLLLTSVLWKKRLCTAASVILPISHATARVLPQTDRRVWGMLCGLSLLALALRLWRLNADLWFDEVLTLLDFVRPPLGEILTSFPSQNQHMFYSVLAHVSVAIFGESAWALRLPSVVFGMGSLWALFALGCRVVSSREALLACALLTVSYHHIWFSQNARGYMGLLCFATLVTWLWLEAFARSDWRWWLAYSLAVSLGMWIHMTMAFVVATHGLLYVAWLLRLKGGKRIGGTQGLEAGMRSRPLVAWLLCGSVTLQLYAFSAPEFLSTALHEVSVPSEWTNPWWVLMESLRSLRIGFAGVTVVLCGGVLVSAGWLSLLRRDAQACFAMTLPPVLAGSTMLLLGHNLWPRFFFFAMGFALLIVVHGAMTVPRLLPILSSRGRLGSQIGMILTGLIIVAAGMTVSRYYALPKQDFTGARDYVERYRTPQDTVVAVGLAGVAYGRYFAPHWSVAQTSEELAAVRRHRSRLWLVYTLPIEVKAYHPDIWQVIEQDFEVVKVFPGTLGGGEVYVCRLRSERQASPESDAHPFRTAISVSWQ